MTDSERIISLLTEMNARLVLAALGRSYGSYEQAGAAELHDAINAEIARRAGAYGAVDPALTTELPWGMGS